MSCLTARSRRYHDELPGFLRATLIDFGVSDAVIDRHELGWDGDAFTVPVRSRTGSVIFLERWEPSAVGTPLETLPLVGLFGWKVLDSKPDFVVLAEGIHEALVFESLGLSAVAASGTGRFFKTREWSAAFKAIPEVLVAFKAGERRERKQHLQARRQIIERVRAAVPHAEEVQWPSDVARDQGAFAFSTTRSRIAEDFLALPRR